MRWRAPCMGLVLVMMLLPCLVSCERKAPETQEKGKLKVITTLFPLYDFARNVGGEHAQATLLVPPGVEPHSFEPRPADVAKINGADVFVYTGPNMEPWVEGMLKGIDNKRLLIVDASRGIKLLPEVGHGGEGHGHGLHGKGHGGEENVDPHVWLDLEKAGKMVENIRDGFAAADPGRKEYYEVHAAQYNAKLRELDEKFARGLKDCAHRQFVSGGHFAFNYLAKRYGLTYVSAYGGSPDAEPTPRRIIELKKLVEENHIKYIYYEELISPRMAEVVASETGTVLLPLHGLHNISRDDLEKGITFLSTMEANLTNLRKGLECR